MHGLEPPGPPSGPVQVVVKLRPDWRWDLAGGHFAHRAEEAAACHPAELGHPVEVRPTAPHLAGVELGSLSEAERDLARFFRFIVPPGVPVEELVDLLRAWPCVESVQVGAEPAPPPPGRRALRELAGQVLRKKAAKKKAAKKTAAKKKAAKKKAARRPG